MGLIYPILILHAGVFFAAIPNAVLGEFTPRGFIMAVIRPLLFLYIPAIVVVAFALLRGRVPILRWPLDVLVLRIPVLGLAIYHMSLCRYARAFGMLYGAGVPIIETTERATRAAGNVVVARQLEGAKASVRAGGMVWEGFSKRIPTEYRQLWQIGEETGELDKIAGKVGDLAGDRADLYFTEFSRWFPRIIYFIIMGFLAYRVLMLWGQVYGGLTTF